jgi:glutathione S-transferase
MSSNPGTHTGLAQWQHFNMHHRPCLHLNILTPSLPPLLPSTCCQAESGAILLYLLDKCGGGTQLPLATRAKLIEWVLFANSTLEECCFGPKR